MLDPLLLNVIWTNFVCRWPFDVDHKTVSFSMREIWRDCLLNRWKYLKKKISNCMMTMIGDLWPWFIAELKIGLALPIATSSPNFQHLNLISMGYIYSWPSLCIVVYTIRMLQRSYAEPRLSQIDHASYGRGHGHSYIWKLSIRFSDWAFFRLFFWCDKININIDAFQKPPFPLFIFMAFYSYYEMYVKLIIDIHAFFKTISNITCIL